MRVKFCPKCEDDEVIMVAGGVIGIWKCLKCGYESSIFPEREIEYNKEDEKDERKIAKNSK